MPLSRVLARGESLHWLQKEILGGCISMASQCLLKSPGLLKPALGQSLALEHQIALRAPSDDAAPGRALCLLLKELAICPPQTRCLSTLQISSCTMLFESCHITSCALPSIQSGLRCATTSPSTRTPSWDNLVPAGIDQKLLVRSENASLSPLLRPTALDFRLMTVRLLAVGC